jgi:hypothetical protein
VPNSDHWRDAFSQVVRDWLVELPDAEMLLLGLLFRYHLSQRKVGKLLHLHEGNVSRRVDKLSSQCREFVENRLRQQGWTGDDYFEYLRTEMPSLLLDEPRLSVDALAHLLPGGKKGVKLASGGR